MAKIFGGDVNFGFVINQTGAQPLDSRSVVKNYTELLKAETFGTALYNGMTVALVDEQKVFMLIDKTKATVAAGWKEIGGTETKTADDYSKAVELSKNLVVGQLIKVEKEYIENAGESDEVIYQKGFYIVEGSGIISALSTSTGSDDEIGALSSRVTTLEGSVNTLEGSVNTLEETVRGDIKNLQDLTGIVTGDVEKLDTLIAEYQGTLSDIEDRLNDLEKPISGDDINGLFSK